MFRRTNNDSKNNAPEAKDENVREESKREEDLKSVLPVGNQAGAGMPPQLPPNIGNEAMNALLNDHYAENMLDLTPLINSRQMNEIIDEAPDLQTQTA